MTLTESAKSLAKWPVEQVKGAWSNLVGGVRGLSLKEAVAPWLVERYRSLKGWYGWQLANALGDGGPVEMMVGSVIVGVSLVIASLTTLTYVAVLFVIPFLIGALRIWPWFNDLWTDLWPLYGSLSWGDKP